MPEQKILLSPPSPPLETVYVSDRVSFRTEETRRVVSVHGVVFAYYDVSDRAAEALTMIMLWESGYAAQNEIAQAFGYSTRSLRRYQERFEAGGVRALMRGAGRPAGSASGGAKQRGHDQIILRLKAKGLSNRAIAAKLGVSEKAIRKRLRRLGWREAAVNAEPSLSFSQDAGGGDTVQTPALAEAPSPASNDRPGDPIPGEDSGQAAAPPPASHDDPLDRSMDRLLAAMGLLEDATPLFAPAENLPRAGVLLAIPALVDSGVLAIAGKIYGSIGPACYGLRTTLVACILLALLRIPRPEALKENPPADLGRIVGLDRMPEVKTLRRKLRQLAARKAAGNSDANSPAAVSRNGARCWDSSIWTAMCVRITANTRSPKAI
jgi:transposase